MTISRLALIDLRLADGYDVPASDAKRDVDYLRARLILLEAERQHVRDALAFCFGDSLFDRQAWRIVSDAFDEAWPMPIDEEVEQP